MRVVRITHQRCGQYSDTSYVCAVGGVTDDDVLGFCESAKDACINAERESKKEAPPYPQEPRLQMLPRETTVGAALDHYQQVKTTYDQWQKKKNAATKTFEDWLYEISGGKIVSLYSATEASKPIEISWGHNHGLSVYYGTEKARPEPE